MRTRCSSRSPRTRQRRSSIRRVDEPVGDPPVQLAAAVAKAQVDGLESGLPRPEQRRPDVGRVTGPGIVADSETVDHGFGATPSTPLPFREAAMMPATAVPCDGLVAIMRAADVRRSPHEVVSAGNAISQITMRAQNTRVEHADADAAPAVPGGGVNTTAASRTDLKVISQPSVAAARRQTPPRARSIERRSPSTAASDITGGDGVLLDHVVRRPGTGGEHGRAWPGRGIAPIGDEDGSALIRDPTRPDEALRPRASAGLDRDLDRDEPDLRPEIRDSAERHHHADGGLVPDEMRRACSSRAHERGIRLGRRAVGRDEHRDVGSSSGPRSPMARTPGTVS